MSIAGRVDEPELLARNLGDLLVDLGDDHVTVVGPLQVARERERAAADPESLEVLGLAGTSRPTTVA